MTETRQLNCKFTKGPISCHVTAHAHHPASHLGDVYPVCGSSQVSHVCWITSCHKLNIKSLRSVKPWGVRRAWRYLGEAPRVTTSSG